MPQDITRGASALNGRSALTGGNPFLTDIQKLEEMRHLVLWDVEIKQNKEGKNIVKLRGGIFAELIVGTAKIVKQAMDNKTYAEKYEENFETAKALAADEKYGQAIAELEEAVEFLGASGASRADIDKIKNVIDNAFNRSIYENNRVFEESVVEVCRKMQEKARAAGDDYLLEAWVNTENMAKEAAAKADQKNVPAAMEMYTCENKNIHEVAAMLQKAGINAQPYYKEPRENDSLMGYLVTPKLSETDRHRINGTIIKANIEHYTKNIRTIEDYNDVCEVMGIKDSLMLDGLAKDQAQILKEELWATKINQFKFAVGVAESPSSPGKYCVVYPRQSEQTVNKVITRTLSQFHGYEKEAGTEDRAAKNAVVHDKVDELLTNMADDKASCGFVFDGQNHFLKIGKGYIEECEAKWDGSKGEWDVTTLDRIEATGRRGEEPFEKEVKNKILTFSRTPVFVGEKAAGRFGVTETEFNPSDQFKKNLSLAYEKIEPEAGRKAATQKRFIAMATEEAEKAMSYGGSLASTVNYIREHKDQLIEQFYFEEKKAAQQKSGKSKQAYLEMADKDYETLKKDGGKAISECLDGIQKDVKGKINVRDYEPDQFTAEAIDSETVDTRNVMVIRQLIDRAEAMLNAPAEENREAPSQEHEEAQLTDETRKEKPAEIMAKVEKYKERLSEQKPNQSAAKTEIQAYAFAFTENIQNAIFNDEKLGESGRYTNHVSFDFEKAVLNVEDKIYEEYGFRFDELKEKDKDGKLTPAIKNLVKQEVASQINESIEKSVAKAKEAQER